MTELLDLCYDVLIQILEEINPEDLAACAQTSWAFNTFIKKNTRLYKAQYLRNFDNPWRVEQNKEPDWVSELQRLVRCQKMLQSANNDLKSSEFKFVASTVEDLIASASLDEAGNSLNQKFVVEMFQYISQNHDAFMSRSALYGRAGKMNQKPADCEESRQLSAKLHSLFGIPSTNVGRRVLSTHPYARSRVYDLRNYTDETKWGPYQDGSFKVDWQMIESIMIVLSYNSGLCCRRFLHRFRPPWSEPLEGVIGDRAQLIKSPLANPGIPKEPTLPLDMQDPYNIAGVWSRIVCFLDYDDLYNYNFSPAAMKCDPESPRDPIDTEEAIRHIIMDLHVTSIEPPSKCDNQALPVVHFNGKSRSVDAAWDPNANSKIRGSVSLTPEGEVRWTTVSVFYGGEERWASEGIQVGGLRSRRGVVGSWFDKDFDPHGPAGPTAFWKICDHNLSEHEDEGSEDSGDDVGNWH